MRILVARMRSIYRLEEVSQRLESFAGAGPRACGRRTSACSRRARPVFQVKPSGCRRWRRSTRNCPFHEVLDDVRRQIALCEASSDALEITPLLLLGPPGVGKTHFARQLVELLGTGHGLHRP